MKLFLDSHAFYWWLTGNAAQGMTELPLTIRHSETASNLPPHHKDPMDRFLIGQAIVADMTILTIDAIFGSYGVKVLW